MGSSVGFFVSLDTAIRSAGRVGDSRRAQPFPTQNPPCLNCPSTPLLPQCYYTKVFWIQESGVACFMPCGGQRLWMQADSFLSPMVVVKANLHHTPSHCGVAVHKMGCLPVPIILTEDLCGLNPKENETC